MVGAQATERKLLEDILRDFYAPPFSPAVRRGRQLHDGRFEWSCMTLDSAYSEVVQGLVLFTTAANCLELNELGMMFDFRRTGDRQILPQGIDKERLAEAAFEILVERLKKGRLRYVPVPGIGGLVDPVLVDWEGLAAHYYQRAVGVLAMAYRATMPGLSDRILGAKLLAAGSAITALDARLAALGPLDRGI